MDLLRTFRFQPYRKGMGPTFTLRMWDTGRTDDRGSVTIAYKLSMREKGKTTVLFDAADYNGPPCCACDSNENAAGLMGFLTLRPGDTDDEYFAEYTPDQLAYAQAHAESLSCEVMTRLGEY